MSYATSKLMNAAVYLAFAIQIVSCVSIIQTNYYLESNCTGEPWMMYSATRKCGAFPVQCQIFDPYIYQHKCHNEVTMFDMTGITKPYAATYMYADKCKGPITAASALIADKSCVQQGETFWMKSDCSTGKPRSWACKDAVCGDCFEFPIQNGCVAQPGAEGKSTFQQTVCMNVKA